MKTAMRPVFRELDRAECEVILSRNHVGRIAYTIHDRVNIEPIHYLLRDTWIFGRTAPGSKLLTLLHNPWVAFEVDEVEGPFDWRSVVVHGTFSPLGPVGTPAERATFTRAMNAITSKVPGAFSADDPVPERNVIFGISVREVVGRAAASQQAAMVSAS
jgi:nitroimidazol reductase NimA-like FMN-containing flavoprotein (pyridoxamine 5'-phosphate oxidase superfamily)